MKILTTLLKLIVLPEKNESYASKPMQFSIKYKFTCRTILILFFLFATLVFAEDNGKTSGYHSSMYALEDSSIFAEIDWNSFRFKEVPAGFLPDIEYQTPKLGIALSGGGARGLAHIGVLQALEANNISPDFISGTSVGAFIGGLYVLGYSADELRKIALAQNWDDLFADAPRRRNLFLAQKKTANRELITLRFKGTRPYFPNALVSGQSLYFTIEKLALASPYGITGDPFRSNEAQFGIVATDLVRGERVLMREADIVFGVRASMSIPLVFRPIRWQEKLLVDGGSVENIPVRSAREMGAEVVIAVDCTSPASGDLNSEHPWQVANQVTTLMTTSLDSMQRALADIVIFPDLTDFDLMDFTAAKAIIDRGRAATEELMPHIKALLSLSSKPTPGIPINVKEVILGAFSETKRSQAIQVMNLTLGETTTREVNQSLKRLSHYLHRQGYGAARINAELLRDGTLLVGVNPGVVKEIIIEGVPSGSRNVVLRDVRVRRGEPLNNEALLQTLTQLHATGNFISIHSMIEQEADGIILRIYLEEAQFPKLGLGLGFDSDRRARYFSELTWRYALLNTSEEFKLFAKYGERDENYSFSISADRLFQSYIGWKGFVNYDFYERDMFMQSREEELQRVAEIRTLTTSFAAVLNLQTWGTVGGSIRAERLENDLREAKSFNVNYYNGFSLKAGLDTKDRHPFPRSGSSFNFQYDGYLTPLGSDVSFNRIVVDAEIIVPVYSRLVAGAAWHNRIADLTTPSTHRFTLGGLNNFPAFPPDRFISLRQVTSTFELRYDLISRFVADTYLQFRYDIGAFSDQMDWRPQREDLVHSLAGGIALDTILGPLEFWYAYAPLTRTAEETYRIAINLGYQF